MSPAPKKQRPPYPGLKPEDPAQHRGETTTPAALANLCIFRVFAGVQCSTDDLLTVPSLFLKPLERPAGCHLIVSYRPVTVTRLFFDL